VGTRNSFYSHASIPVWDPPIFCAMCKGSPTRERIGRVLALNIQLHLAPGLRMSAAKLLLSVLYFHWHAMERL